MCEGIFGDRLQGLLRTDPAPLGVFWCSAGSVLRSLRKLWGGWGFRAVREGILVIASKACFGPIPLRLAYGALRGTGPARAEEALGRFGDGDVLSFDGVH